MRRVKVEKMLFFKVIRSYRFRITRDQAENYLARQPKIHSILKMQLELHLLPSFWFRGCFVPLFSYFLTVKRDSLSIKNEI